ncbi:MAG: 23S rRNA (adenine(2503)-C(2))-methyltransferase RlmN [Terriglobia bacterium]
METITKKPNLFGFDHEDLERLAREYREPPYRGRQIFRAVYEHRERDFHSVTGLARGFREALDNRFSIRYPEVRQRFLSSDGSVRYLLELADGDAVEAVYMPEERRATLCISSQAGCAVACRFCFTALMGLRRNLDAGEILGQVWAILQDQGISRGARLNVVFMGMGEPLLNYAEVMKAIRIMADPESFAIPLRRVTISTAGIIPGIRALAQERERPKLAVSLNASTGEQRTALMPINRKYPLDELIAACREYALRPRERLTFEYVLLEDVNDSDVDAARVAALLHGIRARVNVIPYNSGAALPYRAPALERVLAFQEALKRRGVPAFIRISRGQDVNAACGQLRLAV